jgi:fucose permease
MSLTESASRSRLTVPLAYFAFITIGFAGGLIGVAWSSMQTEFGRELSEVGILLLATTLGYLTASFGSGAVASRFGYGRMFVLGAALLTVGLLGYTVAPVWILLILTAFLGGIGNGTIDAGLNAYMAAHHSARVMNWLHACFGIGITFAPLVMTFSVNNFDWRLGYLIAAIIAGVLCVMFLATRRIWLAPVTQTASTEHPQRRALIQSLRVPLVWLGVFMFVLVAGVEATPGQWGFDILNTARGIDATTAGFWVSVYWASFTIGRIFFGAIMPRLSPIGLVRGCMIGMLFGGVLFWWNPTNTVGILGLVVMGFAQAPLFPVLILNTPRLIGEARASYAIGFQVAGAGLGVAIVPGIAGILAQNFSLETIPPYMVILTLVIIGLNEVMNARASRPVVPVVSPVAGD